MMISNKIKGTILIFLSSIAFSLSTVFAKYITMVSHIHGIEISFVRFFVGFIISLFLLIRQKVQLFPHNTALVLTRAISNTVAVILFYVGVQYTTVTNANMLNMTYPVFVFFLAPFVTKEKIKKIYFIYLIVTLLGTYLVILPKLQTINEGDIYSLLSAIVAAIAIVTLRQARKYDSTHTILFHLMAVGCIVNGIIMIPVFSLPDTTTALLMLLSGLSAYIGQVFLTDGFRFIDAAHGSLISSSRIFIAACLGIYIFDDPLTCNVIIGGILITFALIGVSIASQNESSEANPQ